MKGRNHQDLVRKAQGLAPLRTAVAHPMDEVSLAGAIEAGKLHRMLRLIGRRWFGADK